MGLVSTGVPSSPCVSNGLRSDIIPGYGVPGHSCSLLSTSETFLTPPQDLRNSIFFFKLHFRARELRLEIGYEVMLSVRAHLTRPVGSTCPQRLAARFFQLGSRTSCSPLHHPAHPEEKRARAHPVVMVDMFAADSSQPQFPLHERDLWGAIPSCYQKVIQM